jgi:hypothetical protein
MNKRLDYDVIVVGGGTAGVFAAIAAGRSGGRTLLVERSPFLGGQMAAGMGVGGAHDANGHRVVAGLLAELAHRASPNIGEDGFVIGPPEDRWISSMLLIHPEKIKNILWDMVLEAGCDCMVNTSCINVEMKGDNITALRVFFAGQEFTIQTAMVIDASGDAVVGLLAGAEVLEGDGKGKFQATSIVFSLANVDIRKFEEYMNTVLNDKGRHRWEIDTSACRGCIGEYWLPWKPHLDRVSLPNTIGIYYHGNDGEIFINATHVEINCLETFSYSNGVRQLRIQAFKILDYLKEYVWGCENSYIASFSPVGVRESRRIKGKKILTLRDLHSTRIEDDTICRGAYPPDFHSGYGNVDISYNYSYDYGIPLRVIVSDNIPNLLMCGRCISADHEAAAGIRGMAVCASTGEAAGTAAALAAQNRLMPIELNIFQLRQVLQAKHVIL